MMRFISVLLCLALLGQSVEATDRFISLTGSDTTGNGTAGNPWRTWQKANDSSSSGDRVLPATGFYNENPRLDKAGVTYDGQNTVTVNALSLENSSIKVLNTATWTNASLWHYRLYVAQNAHFCVVSNCVFDNKSMILGYPVIGWGGPVTYPWGAAGSSNLFINNQIKNITDEMVWRINGYQNIITGNYHTNLDNTDVAQMAGGTNYFVHNIVLTLTNTGAFPNNHADIIQVFGNAGGTSQVSWGHVVESNFVYAATIDCQIGNWTDDELNFVGGLIFRNNILIGVSSKVSVAMSGCVIENNLFYSCGTNGNNGGPCVIVSDINGIGHGNRTTLRNNIFANDGVAGLTNNGNGWYHFDATLTNCVADYNYVGKYLGGQWKPIEADPNHAHVIANGGTWDPNLWWEPHGINGGDPKFSNEAQLDFRLLSTSPLIGAGTPDAAFTNDFRGATRSAAWEIGPYEFQQSDFQSYPCYISNRLVNAYSVVASGSTTIYWPVNQYRTELTINRRAFTTVPSAWGTFANLFTLTSASVTNSGSFVDSTRLDGVAYEYQIGSRIPTNTICLDANGYRDYEYLVTGWRPPLKDTRGSVSLWMESGVTNALWAQWTQLQSDLRGAGYKVYPHYAAAVEVTAGTTWASAVSSVKTTIASDYNIDTSAPLYILLVGHIPVPYSGLTLTPGSHTDNKGAHASDLVYADLNGTFTDTGTETSADFPFTHNVAGDGKFDQDYIPSAPEGRIGRVDFRNLPAYSPKTEVQLLSAYLTRNHNWRHKLFTVRQKAIIDSTGQYLTNTTTTDATPLESHSVFSGYFGNTTAVDIGDWLTLGNTANNSYLFAHQKGSGHTNASLQLGPIDSFAASNLFAAFTATYGSYFGSWDSGVQTNAFLPGVLANGGNVVATWYHENDMPVGSSAMDEPIGYEQYAMQSSSLMAGSGKEYIWYYRDFQGTSFLPVTAQHKMYESLMGDPTLLTHQVEPVSGLAVNPSGADNVVTWAAPVAEPGVIGYHVYRALTSDPNNFTRLTTNPTASLSLTDTGASATAYTYMVRTVKLDDLPNRSIYEASQGMFVASTGGGGGGGGGGNPNRSGVSRPHKRVGR
jgi:hypothetical protein